MCRRPAISFRGKSAGTSICTKRMPISLAQCRSCENTFSNKLKKGGDYVILVGYVFGIRAGCGSAGLDGTRWSRHAYSLDPFRSLHRLVFCQLRYGPPPAAVRRPRTAFIKEESPWTPLYANNFCASLSVIS